jgi:hypothetical protein
VTLYFIHWYTLCLDHAPSLLWTTSNQASLSLIQLTCGSLSREKISPHHVLNGLVLRLAKTQTGTGAIHIYTYAHIHTHLCPHSRISSPGSYPT